MRSIKTIQARYTLIFIAFVAVVFLLTDLFQSWLDPRMRQ